MHDDDYQWSRLNLLSLLGPSAGMEQVNELAQECVKSSLFRRWQAMAFLECLPQLVTEPPGRFAALPFVKIREAEVASIRDLLVQGKGLIVCTYHIGAFRFIPFALGMHNFNVSVLGQGHGFDQFDAAIQAANKYLAEAGELRDERLRAITRLNIIRTDRRNATVQAARALKQGGIVVIYVDGNQGADGTLSKTSRDEVVFGGFDLLVKNGAARLALLTGAPILAGCAPGHGHDLAEFRAAEPITDPAQAFPQTAVATAQIMQWLYTYLEQQVRESPTQWESSRFFHRFRKVDPGSGILNAEVSEQQIQDVCRLLEAERAFRLDERKLLPIDSRAGRLWIDPASMKVYRNENLNLLLRRMATGPGLTQQDLKAISATRELHHFFLSCIAQLHRCGAASSS